MDEDEIRQQRPVRTSKHAHSLVCSNQGELTRGGTLGNTTLRKLHILVCHLGSFWGFKLDSFFLTLITSATVLKFSYPLIFPFLSWIISHYKCKAPVLRILERFQFLLQKKRLLYCRLLTQKNQYLNLLECFFAVHLGKRETATTAGKQTPCRVFIISTPNVSANILYVCIMKRIDSRSAVLTTERQRMLSVCNSCA